MEQKNALKIIIGIVIVGLIVYFGLRFKGVETVEAPRKIEEATSTAPTTRNKYEDGTYDALGSYTSPAGAEQVAVSVTLKNDIITSASFDGNSANPISQKLQGQFEAGFQAEVVGKSIDSVALTVVNGSSLTPKGFMDALAKIKVEAKA